MGMEKGHQLLVKRRGVRGHDARSGRPLRTVERAAHGSGLRLADRTAGDQIIDGVPQFRVGIARSHHASDLVAVVDPAGVANSPVAVHEHHLGRGRGVERLGQLETGVEMDRERDAKLPGIRADLCGIVAFADHAHDANALPGEVGEEVGKHRRILLRERAGRMKRRETDGAAIGTEQLIEAMRRAIDAGERESIRCQGGQDVGRLLLADCDRRNDQQPRRDEDA
jgi:hypothetical protein